MDVATQLGLLFAVVLLLAAWQAWRIGNDRRDVALLGVGSGVSALGAGVAFML
ncbi:hypothetical protein ACG02S_03610 [Roseateles sp. DC23W]|uniref:Uncharacterized protein n=1 Tax=Pelomonas dachongensis TaxID=3299029 RepID=A0ABW7EIG6_9BURK